MNKFDLVLDVVDHLGLPRWDRKLENRKLGWKIVNAIMTAMVEGLKRDGYVHVRGFGVLKTKVLKSRNLRYMIGKKGPSAVPYRSKERLTVKFQPSAELSAWLNEENPNVDERRTIRNRDK